MMSQFILAAYDNHTDHNMGQHQASQVCDMPKKTYTVLLTSNTMLKIFNFIWTEIRY